MANRLGSEPGVRQLAAQFVLLKIDTGSDEWPEWSRKYQRQGNGIPIVYVVRADGEQLYGQSGAPDPLNTFLNQALGQSGRILPERQLVQLQRNAEQARKLLDEGRLDRAAVLVGRSAGSGSYAAAAVELDEMAAEFEQTAQATLDEAAENLRSDPASLDDALALVEVERTYGSLPAVRKSIGPVLAEFRRNAQAREVMNQATQIDKARAFEADEKWRQAVAAWQAVQSRFPETPAAEMAAAKLKELEEREGAAAAAATPAARPGSSATPSAPSSADETRAASQVRLGRLLLRNNPAKAREYFERAIELAPESAAADEARKLLEDL